MNKKANISEQDQSLFRDAMCGVKPLSLSKIDLQTSKPKPKIQKKRKEFEESASSSTLSDQFSDYEIHATLGPDDLMEFIRPGLQNKVIRNLRNGKYNIEAILDLHGQTAMEARESLSRFLSACHQQAKRHLLIIHGKGHGMKKPVLKNRLNHWLRETELVLAFCSSSVRDGRGGSLYVLLKGRS